MEPYRAYRVPRENNSRLCIPELDAIGHVLEENVSRLQRSTVHWMDLPLSTVRGWGREDALRLAGDFAKEVTSTDEDLSPPDDGGGRPLIVGGHQPEWFHPGVWFKNFLLSSLAKERGAIGLNFQIDHDLVRGIALSVPTLSDEGQLVKELVTIEGVEANIPWEMSRAGYREAWGSYASSVANRLTKLGINDPMIVELWPKVLTAIERGVPMGEALARARYSVERSAGMITWELPFSRLAAERSFACFVGEILSRIDEFHAIYHSVRQDYRHYHRIKNRLQPIPELGRDEDWYEAPFWIYSNKRPVRRGLWVQPGGDRIRLSDRQGWEEIGDVRRGFEGWFADWKRIVGTGNAIRPRALTTTLYLRLAVGDLFVHGIGGGKYDQMTDRMIPHLWPLAAPHYIVATATLFLPFSKGGSDRSHCGDLTERAAEARIRDWRFSPERLIPPEAPIDPKLEALLREKRAVLAETPTGKSRQRWHRGLVELNEKIRAGLPITSSILESQLADARRTAREQAIRNHREFSIALFPRAMLVERLERLACGER